MGALRKIGEMRNLGPRTQMMLAEVGVMNAAELAEIGAVEAYHRLKFRFGRHVSLLALYAMEAALLDCDWRALDAQTKARLKQAVGR